METIRISVHHFVTTITVLLTLTALILASLAISGHIDYRDGSIPDKAVEVSPGYELAQFLSEVDTTVPLQSAISAVVEDGANALVEDGLSVTLDPINVHSSDVERMCKGQHNKSSNHTAHFAASKDGIAFESGTTNIFTTLKSNPNTATSYSLALPTGDGTANQVIQTDGSGNLSFTNQNAAATVNAHNITAGSGAADVTIDGNGRPVKVTTAGDIGIDSTGGTLTLDGNTKVDIKSANNTADAIKIQSTNAAGGIDVDAGTNGITVDTTGPFSIDSAGGASNISHRATAGGDFTVTMDAGVDASLILSSAGTAADALQISASAGGITMSAAGDTGSIVMTSTEASSWTTTSNATDENLTIELAGATASSLILNSAGTGANAIDINTTAGGIDIDSAGLFTVDATGLVSIVSSATTGNSIITHAGGATSDLQLTCTNGSVLIESGESITDAIEITASGTNGGIEITAGTNGIDFTTTNTTTNAFDFTANNVTSANIINISSTGLTQGKVLNMAVNSLTTGIACDIQSSSTGITGTGRLLNIDHTGTLSTIGVISEFATAATDETVLTKFTASSTLEGEVVDISASFMLTGTALDIGDLNALTTGKGIKVASTSTAITSGELLNIGLTSSGDSISAKTGSLSSVTSSREETRTTGTTADDYDLLSLTRTNIMNGGGGTLTTTGSVLRIENVATQTAGTLTDTTKGLEIVMDADGTGEALHITQSSTTGKSLEIASSSTTGTTALITASALSSGTALHVTSDSANVDARSLVSIKNDNIAAVGATALTVTNDAVASTAGQTVLFETSAATETNPILTLKNSNADANGPILKLFKDSGTSAADGDTVGTIAFDADSTDAGLQTNLANIIVTQEDATAASDNASMALQIMTGNSVTEVARLNPESLTNNTFCGGFGFRYPIFTGAAGTLPATSSGCIVTLSTAAGYAIKLPTPALGLHYKFVLVDATAGGSVTITSTTDGSTAENLFSGIVTTNGAPTSTSNVDVITFVSGTATEGDYLEVYCISTTTTNGNPTWFYKAVGDRASSITAA